MTSWSLVLERFIEGYPEVTNVFGPEPPPIDLTLKGVLTYLYSTRKMSATQIANLTNGECCNTTIRNKLKELGIKLRKKGGANNVKVTSISLEEYKTMSYDQLAAKYEVERTTIYRHVKQYVKTNGKREGRTQSIKEPQ